MWIKICANTNLADAQLAAELGADAVGFVFAPSKRQVTAAQAAAITVHLPSSVEKVGVFATTDTACIIETVCIAHLTAAQLHGRLELALIDALAVAFGPALKIIQTVAYELDAEDRAASDARFEAELVVALTEPVIFAVLLDASKSGVSGGLGEAFHWSHVVPLVRNAFRLAAQSRRSDLPKLILAGGLRADNVANAIATLAPDGVDVASGVEASFGVKDPARLRAFLAAARAA